MNKKDLILHVLSLAENRSLSPVQIQKLLFLIDERISHSIIGGKFFNFKPYDFGPFDKQIYIELDSLITDGLIDVEYIEKVKYFHLKDISLSTQINSEINDKIKNLCAFVKKCSFKELLTAIYNEYPSMAVNTVFKGWVKQS